MCVYIYIYGEREREGETLLSSVCVTRKVHKLFYEHETSSEPKSYGSWARMMIFVLGFWVRPFEDRLEHTKSGVPPQIETGPERVRGPILDFWDLGSREVQEKWNRILMGHLVLQPGFAI